MERKLTDKQFKGIDLSVKALKKVFPFVTGWKLYDNWSSYETKIYIEIFVNYEELSKIVGMEIRPYIKNNLESGESHTSSAIFSIFDWGNFGTEEWEKISKLSYEFHEKISKTLNQAYEYIPDEMKTYWKSSSSSHVVSLGIDNYIFKS